MYFQGEGEGRRIDDLRVSVAENSRSQKNQLDEQHKLDEAMLRPSEAFNARREDVVFGFASASETYFGKKLNDLNLAEIAMLAGLPKAPSRNNPVNNFSKSKNRLFQHQNQLISPK